MESDRLAGILVGWQAAGAGGLSQRLALALRHVLASGVLAEGDVLPTERSLAVALDVSRPTVSAAMAELRRLGLVTSRQGSGTRVSGTPERRTGIDLATAAPFDASHLGPLRLETADLLALSPPTGLGSDGAVVGIESLRERIARRHRRSGRAADAANVLLTTGAHQALAMVIATRVPVGGVVVVEELGYEGLGPLVQGLGAQVRTVRRDRLGVDPSHLDATIGDARPDLVVLLGGVHSPTGVVSPLPRLEQVAAVLDHHGVPVVIDGAGDDLAFEPPIAHLATLCQSVDVASVGTLSKSAWAGLQLGWIITARAEVARLAAYRSTALDHGPSVIAQLFAEQVFEQFDEVCDRRCRSLGDAAEQFVLWLGEALPEWEVAVPDGGLTVWAAPPGADSSDVVRLLAAHGVMVGSGSASRPDGGVDRHVRLCFDRPPALLDEALDRIVAAWHNRT